MTPGMAFECLLVSENPDVFTTMSRILQDLSISTNICLSSRACDLLDEGGTDLVVVDWETENSPELLQKIWKGGKWRKPTVIGISSSIFLC